MNIYNPLTPKINNYGKVVVPTKTPKDFEYLTGMNIDDVILFDNGTEEILQKNKTILPRHYFLFVGIKDNALQFKPYEYNKYRIVVHTYKNIIINIESIG